MNPPCSQATWDDISPGDYALGRDGHMWLVTSVHHPLPPGRPPRWIARPFLPNVVKPDLREVILTYEDQKFQFFPVDGLPVCRYRGEIGKAIDIIVSAFGKVEIIE